MKYCLTMVLMLVLISGATATDIDTGHRMPAKAPAASIPNIPSAVRQGGDTIADAILISGVPYHGTGTTSGYTNDYDEACPYADSTAPDVVYSFLLPDDAALDIDMLGSVYDTKIYLYDEALELVACNDDFYPDYVSMLENVPVVGGVLYYLVIDGYGEEHGDYELTIVGYEPCVLDYPAGAQLEGEPPLVDGYLDAYNSGCNYAGPGYPFQDLHGDDSGELVFYGTSGWYQTDGSSHRDTDWLFVNIGAGGVVELTSDAELPTWIFEMPQDCSSTAVVQDIMVGACDPGAMTISGSPGSVARLWFGPTTISHPGGINEYHYVVHFTGLAPQPVATRSATWTTVKSLFR